MSFFTNVIVVPISNFSLALGFLEIIFNIFSGLLAGAVAEVNNFILSAVLAFIEWSGNLPFSYTSALNFNFISTVAYYSILMIIFTRKLIDYKKKIIFSFLIIICAFVLNLKLDETVRITFFDVGQGDATLIETPEGHNILIDAGPYYQGKSSAQNSIIPYLRQSNIKKNKIC